ncbi:hypothetical protein [Arthrobacter caoxuetaonis]|uniref:Uncharacterized protein n=1 Tax=Arthrobacter caoxuetaonis TaxID=2886935 RepID=A0A9X1MIE1_9MICC|nr:hypothetical protein [Arthrobacter caoxuetaonis]MCC3299497.1 hypothetical protein [Arthrobacter caoxuetaonis]USQ59012.1 hypothetical protein NF551_18065 [Arthrobacter caoxuetaonis]
MDQQPVTIIHGSVAAFEPSFRGGQFQQWNEAYARFVPSEEPVEGPYGAYLEVFEGEWFSVDARGNSEGPTEFLNYRPAYIRSQGAGEYGGTAHVRICTPAKDRVITAVGAGGEQVPVFSQTQYLQQKVSERLVFPHR